MKSEYSDLFAAVEELLRQAGWGAAQNLLKPLTTKKLSGDTLLRFSELTRRANVPEWGLKALWPIVRPQSRKPVAGTELHKVEYAANLLRVGAAREADRFLEGVDLDKNLEALFTKAGIHIKEWDYSLAIPLYRNYIQKTASDIYRKTVGQLNLSMCLIFDEQYAEAAAILNEILVNETKALTPLLKGNAYRFLGGLEFYRGNYPFAMTCFQNAYATLHDAAVIDRFAVRKWIAVCHYILSKGSLVAKTSIEGVRQEAIGLRRWESVREIDYQIGSYHHNEALLLKLYFGTPFHGFRKRLEAHFPKLVIPQTYSWVVDECMSGKRKKINLSEIDLKPGQRPYRLFEILQSDFYRSFSLVDLFEKLFPSQYYAPESAKQRVHQAITTLRRVLNKEHIPLQIEFENSYFHFKALKPLELVCHRASKHSILTNDHRLLALSERFGSSEFDVLSVASIFELSRRTANKIVSDAVKLGLIAQEGAGNKIRYRFIDSSAVEEKKAA